MYCGSNTLISTTFEVSFLNVFVRLYSTPTGVETPDVIDLRKQQRKEPEKPLYQVIALYVACCFLHSNRQIYFLIVKNLTTTYLSFKVLEEREEKIAPGTLLGTTHT